MYIPDSPGAVFSLEMFTTEVVAFCFVLFFCSPFPFIKIQQAGQEDQQTHSHSGSKQGSIGAGRRSPSCFATPQHGAVSHGGNAGMERLYKLNSSFEHKY